MTSQPARRTWLRVLAVPVALTVAVSTCTTSFASHVTARPTGMARGTGRRRRVTVRDGRVYPALEVVELGVGEVLALTVDCDVDAVVQAPELDVEQLVQAGVPSTVWLVGGRAGVHDVELALPSLVLLRVCVA